jgi:hypothetical protein
MLTTSQGSYQIVPPLMPTAQSLNITIGASHNWQNTTNTINIGPTVQYGTMGTFVIDPMTDHYEWYGFDASNKYSPYLLDGNHLIWKLTDMAEITRLMDEQLTDVVLVQATGYKMWNMHFKSKVDRVTMEDIMRKLQPTHVKLLRFPEELEKPDWAAFVDEVTEWCNVTLSGRHRLTNSFHCIEGDFKLDSDAALFKLKWTFA